METNEIFSSFRCDAGFSGLRLAIFGGTFDPIHKAHLIVAREAAIQFDLDRILIVPAANPPHKSELTEVSFEHRLRMVQLACEGDPRLEASDLEAGLEKSYSIRTIEKLRQRLSAEDKLFFLIGADAFAEIMTWFRWQEVIESVEFIVVTRPGHCYTALPGAAVHELDTLALPVSSSAIRAELRQGGDPDQLPQTVLRYIKEHRLYQADRK